MDVFLIPVAADRYEPYCESSEVQADQEGEAPPRGLLRQAWRRFQLMLRAAEQEQRKPEADRDTASWTGRLMAWVAERVAEQRLLWHLRKVHEAALHFPADLPAGQAERVLRIQLRQDADRHRRWMYIDAILTGITGPLLFFVPGPNLVAYFFLFRAVGHYLSQRGARHGLDRVKWIAVPSDPLVDLRRAIGLEDPQRSERVQHVAARLRLPQLPVFVSRVVVRGA